MTCANHPDRQNTVFCQNCGKPLCGECARPVGNAVFCEPCLVARLGGAPGPIPGTAYPPPSAIPPVPGEPSPTLAAILGLIPGVGAMYNGQYAKGIIHLAIFAALVSLSHEVGIFGLFVAGWVFYQVIDAHHTARARRDGMPLPNPFGINELADRLGFDSAQRSDGIVPPASVPAAGPPPPPPDPAASASTGTPPPQPPYSYNYSYSYQYPPVAAPPEMTEEQMEEMMKTHTSRFPTAAFWLIGLGLLFSVSNTHWFPHSTARELMPLLLICFGIWMFFRRMTGPRVFGTTGIDAEAAQRAHLLWAINGSFWMVFVGFLWLLDTWHVVRWGHSWPLFLIGCGLLLLIRRTAFVGAVPQYMQPPVPPAPPADAGTAIVPKTYSSDERQ